MYFWAELINGINALFTVLSLGEKYILSFADLKSRRNFAERFARNANEHWQDYIRHTKEVVQE